MYGTSVLTEDFRNEQRVSAAGKLVKMTYKLQFSLFLI